METFKTQITMTGSKITTQIIESLKECVLAQNATRNLFQIRYAMDMETRFPTMISSYNIEESFVALSCEISLPKCVKPVIRILNQVESSIFIKRDQKYSLNELWEIFSNNELKIATAIQVICDNPDIKFHTGKLTTTLFDFLINRIDILQDEAEQVKRAYSKYLRNKELKTR